MRPPSQHRGATLCLCGDVFTIKHLDVWCNHQLMTSESCRTRDFPWFWSAHSWDGLWGVDYPQNWELAHEELKVSKMGNHFLWSHPMGWMCGQLLKHNWLIVSCYGNCLKGASKPYFFCWCVCVCVSVKGKTWNSHSIHFRWLSLFLSCYWGVIYIYFFFLIFHTEPYEVLLCH